MRIVLYFLVSSASVAGSSERRCVAITVQPRARYCFVNSSPMPELAPVTSTVWPFATAGTIDSRKPNSVMIANGCRLYATGVVSLKRKGRDGSVDEDRPCPACPDRGAV